MAQTKTPKKRLRIELIKQMIALSTAGFGLVAALAWNSLIQEIVNNYIKKYLPGNSGIISLAFYAIVITIIAVVITYQLTGLLERVENE